MSRFSGIRETVKEVMNAFDGKSKSVDMAGWVHRIRVLKRVVFIVLRDRTGLIQCTLTPAQFDALQLTLETTISLSGVVMSSKNDLGNCEVVIEELTILNRPYEEIPIQINHATLEIGLDTQLQNRVLTLRHEGEQAIFRIQSALVHGFSDALRQEDFTQIFSPKLVKEGAEGGANVFSLDYFGEKAYLAQSPQFYKQMMVIAGFERVFEVAPVFRAEAYSTSRHLNEYISLDVEMGFIDSIQTLMALETDLIQSMLHTLTVECSRELKVLGITLPVIPQNVPQIDFNEALELLAHEFNRSDLDGDLDPEAERQLCEFTYEKTGSEFLFVTNYPRRKRPMYAMPKDELGTESFDLLFRGLEVTTGGLRLHDRLMLEESMILKGLNPNEYSAYLQAFNHGVPPHGGFAIGLERLTAQLLGYTNVRRTSAFPRDGQRLLP